MGAFKKEVKNGNVYVGQFVDGKFEGKGRYLWANGNYYQGCWLAGNMSGFGAFVWTDGSTYQGYWKDGRHHGWGILTNKENNKVYCGWWENGQLTKETAVNFTQEEQNKFQKIVYKTGCYQGEVKSGKKHGFGRMVWNDGSEYVGFHFDDLRKGQGRYVWADGSYYQGEWANNKRNGKGKYVFPSGAQKIGKWKDSEFVFGTYRYANGNVYVGQLKDSKMHGYGKHTFANGTFYVGDLAMDKFHGKGKMTWSNGDKYVGWWRDNVRSGEGEMRYANGVVEKGFWRNGKMEDMYERYTPPTEDQFNSANVEQKYRMLFEMKKRKVAHMYIYSVGHALMKLMSFLEDRNFASVLIEKIADRPKLSTISMEDAYFCIFLFETFVDQSSAELKSIVAGCYLRVSEISKACQLCYSAYQMNYRNGEKRCKNLLAEVTALRLLGKASHLYCHIEENSNNRKYALTAIAQGKKYLEIAKRADQQMSIKFIQQELESLERKLKW